MNIKKIIYWISTGLLCLIFLYSASMYFLNTEMVKGFFEGFNYPTYLVIPLAVVKLLGVLVVLLRKPLWLMEWAYAGFLFDLILASTAHYNAGHGTGLSVFAIPVLFVSYFLGKSIRS